MNERLFFPTLSYPLNAYAQALWYENGEVKNLHYGSMRTKQSNIIKAQQAASEKLYALIPDSANRILEVGIGLGTTALDTTFISCY